jgi:hypothetical protein
LITDPYGIILDKACDPNKKPIVTVFKCKEGVFASLSWKSRRQRMTTVNEIMVTATQ